MLKCITINRFRGIRSLMVSDFAKVNIFIGTNSAGKTSILEAISLAANPSPHWLVTLSQWRDMQPPSPGNDDALRVYFYDLDLSQSPELKFSIDEHSYRLTVEPIIGGISTVTSTASEASSSSSGETRVQLRGIRVAYQTPDGKTAKTTLEMVQGGFRENASATRMERLGCFYVHARRATSIPETARLLTTLYEQKREGLLIDMLRRIDPRVQRFFPGTRNTGPTVLVDVGLAHMLPINVLGDGFCRAALMATGLLVGNTKALVVDEIDSGLHYSVMKSVWNGLAGLARDKQVFCATHNEEMLSATLDAFDDCREDLRVFRIDRHDDGEVTVEKFDYEAFELSDRARMEIR
jgi:hypothetical protein